MAVVVTFCPFALVPEVVTVRLLARQDCVNDFQLVGVAADEQFLRVTQQSATVVVGVVCDGLREVHVGRHEHDVSAIKFGLALQSSEIARVRNQPVRADET